MLQEAKISDENDDVKFINLVDFNKLDMYWGWKKVTLQRKSFVLNQEHVETEKEADHSWGGAVSFRNWRINAE